jgi:catechol 2,3-dioxygenase-like lactoylglutathione lyase family enzyme
MSELSGLSKYNIIGFVSIVNVPRAIDFYRNILGLRLISEEAPFALVFDANGIMLRLGMAKELPQPMARFRAGKSRRSPQPLRTWGRREFASSATEEWTKMSWASGPRLRARGSPGLKIPTGTV